MRRHGCGWTVYSQPQPQASDALQQVTADGAGLLRQLDEGANSDDAATAAAQEGESPSQICSRIGYSLCAVRWHGCKQVLQACPRTRFVTC